MMCLGIPGLVTELDQTDRQYAWVDVGGAKRRVNVALLADDAAPAPGDWVLLHVGFALARIDEDEAQATLRMLEGMAGAYTDELAVMARSGTERAAKAGDKSAQSGPRGPDSPITRER